MGWFLRGCFRFIIDYICIILLKYLMIKQSSSAGPWKYLHNYNTIKLYKVFSKERKNRALFFQLFIFPVSIMKKFVKLMLYVHWFRKPLRWANIFWYSSSFRKAVALVVNISVRENQIPLQQSYISKVIATKPLQLIHCNKGMAKQMIKMWFRKSTSW